MPPNHRDPKSALNNAFGGYDDDPEPSSPQVDQPPPTAKRKAAKTRAARDKGKSTVSSDRASRSPARDRQNLSTAEEPQKASLPALALDRIKHLVGYDQLPPDGRAVLAAAFAQVGADADELAAVTGYNVETIKRLRRDPRFQRAMEAALRQVLLPEMPRILSAAIASAQIPGKDGFSDRQLLLRMSGLLADGRGEEKAKASEELKRLHAAVAEASAHAERALQAAKASGGLVIEADFSPSSGQDPVTPGDRDDEGPQFEAD